LQWWCRQGNRDVVVDEPLSLLGPAEQSGDVQSVWLVELIGRDRECPASEQCGRSSAVAACGVRSPDGELSQPTPKLAFISRAAPPRVLEYLVRMERQAGLEKTFGLAQRFGRGA
jgi:hypothetical protein